MDGYLTIGTEVDDSGFDAQIIQIENKLNDLKSTLSMADNDKTLFSSSEIVNMESEVEKLSSKLNNLKKRQSELNDSNWKNMKESVDNVGSSVSKTVGKVGKWALAVFAVESAYSGIRRVISTIQQYDTQMNSNMQYMSYALANIFKPVVEWLVNGLYKILVYVNMISKAWFGVDLFANSSAKAFSNAQKSAEKLKKTMAGFDTANVLSDSSSNSSSSAMPSFDLSAPQEAKIPSWLQWIIDNKDVVIGFISGVTGGLIALKILGLDPIKSLGIGAIIMEIVMLVQDIMDFIKDPSWQGFFNILGDVAIIIGTIMILMGSWWGLLVIFAGMIVKLVADNWDKISVILGQILGWIYDYVIKPVGNFIGGLFDAILSTIDFAISLISAWFFALAGILISPFVSFGISVKDTATNVFNFFKNMISGICKLFTGDLKGALNSFKSAFGNVFGALWSIAKAPLNLIIGGINGLISGANRIQIDIPDWVPFGLGGTKFGLNLPKIKYLKNGGIVDVPRTGVAVANNVRAGEAGPEAVLPLNDENMERIAKYIARYININIDLTSKIDSRVLVRILKQIIGEQEFATNGG